MASEVGDFPKIMLQLGTVQVVPMWGSGGQNIPPEWVESHFQQDMRKDSVRLEPKVLERELLLPNVHLPEIWGVTSFSMNLCSGRSPDHTQVRFTRRTHRTQQSCYIHGLLQGKDTD